MKSRIKLDNRGHPKRYIGRATVGVDQATPLLLGSLEIGEQQIPQGSSGFISGAECLLKKRGLEGID